MKKTKASYFLIAIALLFITAGCFKHDLTFRIQFDHVNGLKKGDRVLFDGTAIGSVEKVVYTEKGKFLVHVKIDENFAMSVTDKSRFFIIDDQLYRGHKAVEMIHVAENGTPIVEGSVVVGSSRLSALSDKAMESFRTNLSAIQKQFDEFCHGLKDLSRTDKLKRLEQKIDQLTKRLAEQGKSSVEKFNREVIPYLKQQLDELKRRLKRLQEQNSAKDHDGVSI